MVYKFIHTSNNQHQTKLIVPATEILQNILFQTLSLYFTLARYRPQAGAIAGAAVTAFASRILSTASEEYSHFSSLLMCHKAREVLNGSLRL